MLTRDKDYPTSGRGRAGVAVGALLLSVLCVRPCVAQPVGAATPQPTTAPAGGDYVSREEYERRIGELLRQQQLMREEIEALRRERSGTATAPALTAPVATTPGAPGTSGVQGAAGPRVAAARHEGQAGDDTRRELDDLRAVVDQLKLYRPGLSQFVLSGDAAFGFTSKRHDNSTFEAGIAPLVLYRPVDRLLIEAAADIGVGTDSDGNSSTSFDLTIANVTYEVTDNLMVGAGLFVVPFGVYHNHFDPPWINKFPDDPLPFGDSAIAPSSEVGVFVRGAVPAGPTKITYDAYVTNGPQLITRDPDAAGSLNFDDFTDLNGNKAVGGRIGFLPFPNMELGYSIQVSDPQPSGFKRAHATLQAFDFNFRPTVEALSGVLDVRGEWVLSDVTKATYDPTGAIGFGPTRFGNYRQGGYVQVGYRPTLIANEFLRNIEFVGRYDWVTAPLNAPGGDHEKRVTLGVDYWLAPNAVLKFAYEFDDRKVSQSQDAFLVQFGIGL